ncbi:MAG: DUF4163 domain-containing protein [Lachnospiraceae bacterium]|nr:DUF4163 domain-containing protein [Lachnospiraceae bacterium]
MKRKHLRNVVPALTLAVVLALTACGPSILKEESGAAEESAAEEPTPVMMEDIDLNTEPETGEAAAESGTEETAAAPEETPDAGAEQGAEEAEPGPAGGRALSVQIGTTSLVDYKSEDSYEPVCTVTYPTVLLANGDEVRYADLENALESKNEKFRRDAGNVFETLKADVRQYENIDDEYFMGYTDEKTFSVIRADDRILSLCGPVWSFTGGAHGQYGYASLNLDAETGRELAVRDIASDPVALMDKVKELLAQQAPGMEENLIDSADMVSEGIADMKAWTMGYDSFKMWFGAGEIGAYAEGVQIVSIPFAGNESLFNEKYLSVPESYGFDLVERTCDLDVDGDGVPEHLELYPKMNEEDSGVVDDLQISLDGNSVTEKDLYAFDFTSYIARTGGKTFLYIEYGLIDDVSETAVYDLTGGTPAGSCRTRFRPYVRFDKETQTSYRYAFSDPEYSIFGIRSDVLGTNPAYAYVHAGEDGAPVVDDGIYLLRDFPEQPMTLKRDMEGDEIDPSTGEPGGKISLPAGLGVDPYRTDFETFVEITTEDGNLVRFEYTPGPPDYVNGIDVNEVFNNIMYAG